MIHPVAAKNMPALSSGLAGAGQQVEGNELGVSFIKTQRQAVYQQPVAVFNVRSDAASVFKVGWSSRESAVFRALGVACEKAQPFAVTHGRALSVARLGPGWRYPVFSIGMRR
ncbi:hypothetical protein [Hydrogenophaga sp.]|uniref:hypothetical protein n=1 Tax=Hydrogenophaga sp. TaxID=1904254 RepID=UPI003F6BF237